MKRQLTIFTPTYNRANLLPRLYESLINQTNYDFNWLVVDDGSTDNTIELLHNWQIENKICINYYKQNNRGKYVAHNIGVKLCTTEYFVCVDSDDWLVSNAVNTILIHLLEISSSKIAGLVAYCGSNNLRVVGTEFPEGLNISSLHNLYKKGFKGDTTLILKTNILLQNLFPESEEKFFPEQYIYDRIDQKFSLMILPSIIKICEYQQDGYTQNIHKILKNNPNNYLITLHQRLLYDVEFSDKCIDTIRYIALALAAHKKGFIKRSVYPILTLLLLPVGWAFKKVKYDS